MVDHPRSRIAPSSRSDSASIHSASGDSAGIDAAATTVTVEVLLLFAGFVSGLAEVTVAVLETVPGVGGSCRTSEMVAEAPLASVPRLQVTVVVPLHVP